VYELGIITEPGILFDQRSYKYSKTDLAKDTGKSVFTYYSTTWTEPLGFTMDRNIHLSNAECYDCWTQKNWSSTNLDNHRLCAYTACKYSTFSGLTKLLSRITFSNDFEPILIEKLKAKNNARNNNINFMFIFYNV